MDFTAYQEARERLETARARHAIRHTLTRTSERMAESELQAAEQALRAVLDAQTDPFAGLDVPFTDQEGVR